MAIRPKTRRRVTILAVAALAAAGAVVGLYQLRQWRHARWLDEQHDAGMAAFEAGEHATVLETLPHWIRAHDDDIEALYRLAHSRLEVPAPNGGHIRGAIPMLRRIEELRPDHPTARHELLDLYVRVGFRTETLALADRILATPPDDPKALRAKAAALAMLRRIDEGLAVAKRCVEIEPASRRELLVLYAQLGYRAEMLELAEHCVQVEPAARAEVLDLYGRLGYQAEALALADRILAANADDPTTLRAKALALDALGRHDEALAVAERCIELVPTELATQMLRLDLLKRVGRPQAAIVELAEQLRKAHPADQRFETLLGYAHFIGADRAAAIPCLEAAAGLEPPDLASAALLVRLLDMSGKFEQSRAVLEKASTATGDPELEREIVRRLWEQGRAQEVADRLSELDAGTADTFLVAMRAMALQALGRADEAGPLVAALAGRAQDEVAAAWASVLGQPTGAAVAAGARDRIERCSAAVGADPANAYFHAMLGQAYAGLGEQELALGAWRRAAQLRPVWSGPRLQQARALLALGRPAEAVIEARAAGMLAPASVDAAVTWALARAGSLGRTGAGAVKAAEGAKGAVEGGEGSEVGPAAAAAAGQGDSTAEVLKLLQDIQRQVPGEPRTLALCVAMLAEAGKKDEAVQVAQTGLDREEPLPEETLLQLAAVSRQAGLGLEEASMRAAESAYGVSADQALVRALALAGEGRREEGAKLLADSRAAWAAGRAAAAAPDATAGAGGPPGAELAWDLAQARFLDQSDDPGATQAWTALAEAQAGNPAIQRLALDARCVQADKEFLDATIERLRALTGDEGVTWRVKRARWLMQFATEEDATARAAEILAKVVEQSPQTIEARLLRATGLERLEKLDEAIAELTAASNLRPDADPIALDLARLHQARLGFDEAGAYLERVARKESDARPEDRRRAAAMLAGQGEIDQAIRTLEELSADPASHQPADDLRLAQLYLSRDRIAEVEALCNERLLAEPTAPGLEFVASFYARQGRMAEAEQVLARLDGLELEPGLAALLRAEFAARYVGAEQALARYEEAVKAAPDRPVAWSRLVSFHLARGEADAALAAVDRALAALGENERLAFVKGKAELVKRCSPSTLLRPLVLALLNDPANRDGAAECLSLLGDADQGGKKVGAVLAELRGLVGRHPRLLEAQTFLAGLLLRMGRHAEAAEVASRAERTFPTAAEPAALAAEALGQAGRWQDALGAAQRWRERSAGEPLRADLMIAEARLRLGDVGAALAQVEPYLERARKEPDLYRAVLLHYARSLVAAGRAPEAAELLAPYLARSAQWRADWMTLAALAVPEADAAAAWLDQVEAAIPADAVDERVRLVQAWLGLAQRLGRPDHRVRAATLIDAVVAMPGANAAAWFQKGTMAEADGDLASAESSYRTALGLDANLHPAKNNLAMVLTRKAGPDLAEARQLATEAVGAMPQAPPDYLDTLAVVLTQTGEHAGAIETMRRAVALDPANRAWQERLAEVLRAAGQEQEANAILDSLKGGQAENMKD